MAHSFLSLDMNIIPQSTKDNVPTFNSALFSNDNSRMLIDGRNGKGELVHPMTVLQTLVKLYKQYLMTLSNIQQMNFTHLEVMLTLSGTLSQRC